MRLEFLTSNGTLKQAPLYNCSLSLYYLFVIRFNWTNEQLVKIERYVHGFIIVFSVGISIAGLPTKMYSKINTVCWVIGVPSECGNSSSEPSDIPCERGDWAWPFGILLFYGHLWLCVLLTIIAMIMIYVHVRNTFRKNEKYQFQGKLRRPTSVMTRNRSGHTEPTQVKTESGMTDSGRPPQGGNSGGTQVDSVGQISSRMGRFSVFSAQKKADLRKLDEPQGAMGQKEQGDIDGVDHAEEEKQSEAGMKKSERNGDSRLSPPHGR